MIKDISLVTPGRLYLPFRAHGDEPYHVASGVSAVVSDLHDPDWSVHKFHFKYALIDLANPDDDTGFDALERFYENVRFRLQIPTHIVLQPIVTNGAREVSLDLSTVVVEQMPYAQPLMALEITPGEGFDRTCFLKGHLTTSKPYADALNIMSKIKDVVRSRRMYAN